MKARLDAWRDAERRRDARTPTGSGQQEVDEEIRTAKEAFQDELARVSARYADEEHQDTNRGWPGSFGRRVARS
jgi:hypothetical protein